MFEETTITGRRIYKKLDDQYDDVAHSWVFGIIADEASEYRFSLRRWPGELGLPIDETISEEDAEVAEQEAKQAKKIKGKVGR